jgi:sugar lactone lactonase YvrE
MLTDLQRGPDGDLYAVQFGMFTEQGPVPNAGSVVRIHEGNASEVLVSGLPFPTSLAFDQDGNAFVTINGLGAPGSGAAVRFDRLIDMTGESVVAVQ